MECVSISSNDMLQLGVVLLSYMELLQDSTGKKSHISQTENNNSSNARHLKIFLGPEVCVCVVVQWLVNGIPLLCFWQRFFLPRSRFLKGPESFPT